MIGGLKSEFEGRGSFADAAVDIGSDDVLLDEVSLIYLEIRNLCATSNPIGHYCILVSGFLRHGLGIWLDEAIAHATLCGSA